MFDVGFDEAGFVEHGSDGVDGVSRFEDAGTCFEEERGHEEVVVSGDEGDVHALMFAKDFFEAVGGVDAAESAAEDDDLLDVSSGFGVVGGGGWRFEGRDYEAPPWAGCPLKKGRRGGRFVPNFT